ncbi:methylmalonyl Co-A mutase-associated GTPase MeaB [Mesobacillus zeae]|uniref:Methylmalonyl Co-A mutase-associated GTPase MeaB n=1 Tax=Mesobacillus zeae TaxID=1917180 RepID=A0A398B7Q8_9BACI|nr:methylmalonyl Co-A mutase-associated GTPase MeaB [Mesobacillus zeae]RID83940.1 methylmalonyl Co-A mutase-associated GTPase MeaB [Mesobacillus zeae]
MADDRKPEWFEPKQASSFAGEIRKGVTASQDHGIAFSRPGRFVKKAGIPGLEPKTLAADILKGNRVALARAITLVESNAERHFEQAQQLLKLLLPKAGRSIRIGITGVPGAGKSTFIEAFGSYLCSQGHRVAVLAVDPTSSLTGGSILGDKTRMEKLAGNPHAFIRPSPSGGKLGGVHRKTRETMLLCEAAGFDVILVETVGVGQSEILVRGMVDFFMLLALTGAGDELQGMKKGIMEIADMVLINKADGPNEAAARKTTEEYRRILHFLQPSTKGWESRALSCSSVTGSGISDVWNTVEEFEKVSKQSGVFAERRRIQSREWIHALISDQLEFSFYNHPEVKALLPKVENEVIAGTKPVASGVEELFQAFFKARP